MTKRTEEQYAAELHQLALSLVDKLKTLELLDGPIVDCGSPFDEAPLPKDNDSVPIQICVFGTDEPAQDAQLAAFEGEVKRLGWNIEEETYEPIRDDDFSIVHYNISPAK